MYIHLSCTRHCFKSFVSVNFIVISSRSSVSPIFFSCCRCFELVSLPCTHVGSTACQSQPRPQVSSSYWTSYRLVSCVTGISPRTLTVVFRKLSVAIIWDPGSLERILVSCVGYWWILLFLMSDLSVLHGEEIIGVSLICNVLWPGSPHALFSLSCETAWLPRAKSVF